MAPEDSDMPVIGTTLLAGDGSAYYSPEFPRGGLAATMTVEMLNYSVAGASGVTFDVETRNSEDTTWTALSGQTINATGVQAWNVQNVKEIVRFKISFAGTPTTSDMVHFLMQAPSWRPY